VTAAAKVAIITGASQGIGEGLVRGYRERGCRVVDGDIADPAETRHVDGGAHAGHW
jgi:NAD(P)-dependent dehydrogenase (short-subunit alcohol dehydrogenase family)